MGGLEVGQGEGGGPENKDRILDRTSKVYNALFLERNLNELPLLSMYMFLDIPPYLYTYFNLCNQLGRALELGEACVYRQEFRAGDRLTIMVNLRETFAVEDRFQIPDLLGYLKQGESVSGMGYTSITWIPGRDVNLIDLPDSITVVQGRNPNWGTYLWAKVRTVGVVGPDKEPRALIHFVEGGEPPRRGGRSRIRRPDDRSIGMGEPQDLEFIPVRA